MEAQEFGWEGGIEEAGEEAVWASKIAASLRL